ncbi:Stage II sporulation protein E (SpoIIE) [Streptomyces sp. ADI96-02]|uniref:PP2C family protein-serine/threonine phosphatase n=1 Tax=unclassified Streptomyces TaxID=2593676 RepID=UPI000F5529E7|nr:PP2C family protein-serine/threonine phosphatase [Streptomyces sp. ADI96-02]RPK69284.1 Stage II sporulation protein E (SpoIIE) [Streptomyces sp. ADI96-02]
MDRLTDRWAYARWAPPVIIVAAVVLDVATPHTYTGVPLVAAACVMAGAMLRFKAAFAVGVFALTITFLLSWSSLRLTSALGWAEIVNVVIAIFIGLDMNLVLERHRRRLASIRTVSEAMQRAVLPTPPERIGVLRVAARYEAADAEARIGGDAYAIQDTPYGVRVLIGDVRGKGISAVSTTSTLIGAFREAAHYAPDISTLSVRLEDALGRDNAQHPDEIPGEEFTTALIAEIDRDGRTLRIINRGHPEPYLLRDGCVTPLATTPDLPLGMGELTGRRSDPDVFCLASDDVLLLVTDGVTEARNADGDFYDPSRSLQLPPARPLAPAVVLDELTASIHHWTDGPRDDDMATLAIGTG